VDAGSIWYLDRNGPPIAWPSTFDRFRKEEEMDDPRLDADPMR
jgi:hypothetical protein